MQSKGMGTCRHAWVRAVCMVALCAALCLTAAVAAEAHTAAAKKDLLRDVSRRSLPKMQPHLSVPMADGANSSLVRRPASPSKSIKRCPIDKSDEELDQATVQNWDSKLICQIDMKTAIINQSNHADSDKCPRILNSRCIPESNYFLRKGNNSCHIQCPNFFPTRRCGPSVFIIGAMKAATTSFYGFLSTHPDFCKAKQKELHFYGVKASPNKADRIEAYLKNFPNKRHCLSGEATPMYSITKSAALQIKEDWPDARIIFLMRNPSLRAKSHYDMALDRIARGDQKDRVKPFDLEMKANIETTSKELVSSENGTVDMNKLQHIKHYAYVERGMYASQLEFWLAQFPPEQILVGSFEDMINPLYQRCMLKTILKFIGLRSEDLPKGFEFVLPHRNAHSHSANVSAEQIQTLDDFFRPFNRRLDKLLGRKTGYST